MLTWSINKVTLPGSPDSPNLLKPDCYPSSSRWKTPGLDPSVNVFDPSETLDQRIPLPIFLYLLAPWAFDRYFIESGLVWRLVEQLRTDTPQRWPGIVLESRAAIRNIFPYNLKPSAAHHSSGCRNTSVLLSPRRRLSRLMLDLSIIRLSSTARHNPNFFFYFMRPALWVKGPPVSGLCVNVARPGLVTGRKLRQIINQ